MLFLPVLLPVGLMQVVLQLGEGAEDTLRVQVRVSVEKGPKGAGGVIRKPCHLWNSGTRTRIRVVRWSSI